MKKYLCLSINITKTNDHSKTERVTEREIGDWRLTGPSFLVNFNTDNIQSRLLKIAALFGTLYSLTLTLAPAARARTWQADLNWTHWLGFGIWLGVFYIIHNQTRKYAPNIDPILVPISALLTGWGILSIYRLSPFFGLRQSIWLVVAGGIFIAGLRLKPGLSFLRDYKYLWLFSGLGLTALTFVFGVNPSGIGPRLWLGCCGLYLQPSEPLKLLLIIYLAAYLADRQPFYSGLMPLLIPTLIMTGITLLMLVIQRDLGTVSLFIFIYSAVIYAATGKWRTLIASLVLLSGAGVAGYNLFDVVRLRVDAWINPWIDPSGRSYQIVQSLIALANGGIFGRGAGLGSPGLVPVPHSDFIFSSIAEEGGLLASVVLFLLLALLSLRGLRIALQARHRFERYLAVGFSVYIAGQSLLIIGGNIRLLPLTGVTLPFVSYGGSSLVTVFMALVILGRVSLGIKRKSAPQSNPRPILNLGIAILVGFGAAALVNAWWGFVRGPDLLARTDNPRRGVSDRFVQRGSLLDANDTPLNISSGAPGGYERIYLYPDMGNIFGYTDPIYGQAGLESSLDNILRGIENQSAWVTWINHLLYGQPPPGLDARLTLDIELQNLAQQSLSGTPGAAALINASSGEILAMVSNPNFDPNDLDENWGELTQASSAPLVNRVTQGQYQPGTALGPFLLAFSGTSEIRNAQISASEYPLGEITLTCALQRGGESLGELIAAGCPQPLAEMGLILGSEGLAGLFSLAGFYTPPSLRLPVAIVDTPLIITAPATDALGQSNLRLTPLQMVLAAAAISNAGEMPAPKLLDAVEDPAGGWTTYPALGQSTQVFEAAFARQAVQTLSLHSDDLEIWQTVALAYLNPSQPLTWYLGGTLPGAETPYAVVVLLETDEPLAAEIIGQRLLAAVMSVP